MAATPACPSPEPHPLSHPHTPPTLARTASGSMREWPRRHIPHQTALGGGSWAHPSRTPPQERAPRAPGSKREWPRPDTPHHTRLSGRLWARPERTPLFTGAPGNETLGPGSSRLAGPFGLRMWLAPATRDPVQHLPQRQTGPPRSQSATRKPARHSPPEGAEGRSTRFVSPRSIAALADMHSLEMGDRAGMPSQMSRMARSTIWAHVHLRGDRMRSTAATHISFVARGLEV